METYKREVTPYLDGILSKMTKLDMINHLVHCRRNVCLISRAHFMTTFVLRLAVHTSRGFNFNFNPWNSCKIQYLIWTYQKKLRELNGLSKFWQTRWDLINDRLNGSI